MAGYKYQIITAAAYNFSWDCHLFLLCYFQIYICWPPLPPKNKTDTDLKLIDYSLSLAIWKIIYAVRSVSKKQCTSLSSHMGLFCWTVILSWTGVLVMWLHTFLPLGQRRSSINSQNTGWVLVEQPHPWSLSSLPERSPGSLCGPWRSVFRCEAPEPPRPSSLLQLRRERLCPGGLSSPGLRSSCYPARTSKAPVSAWLWRTCPLGKCR